jgi:deoxyribodipyrimidine photo-lyase
MSTIVWLRNDLRTHDHPALVAACARGEPVVPVYIHSEDGEGDWPLGGATKWWLHRSLASLEESLKQHGSKLILRRGNTLAELQSVIRESQATAVYWGRRYEPAAIARDKHIKATLAESGLQVESFNTSLLWEPWTIRTGGNECYKVFTPFWRKCVATGGIDPVQHPPTAFTSPTKWPRSVRLDDLELQPKIAWDKGLAAAWIPGRQGGERELARFSDGAWKTYKQDRDFPSQTGTSRLSPHLHFGEISPREVWHHLHAVAKQNGLPESSAEPYTRQLVWREFAFHLLFHFPHTPLEPLRSEYARFPWKSDARGLRAWQRGRTGYPLIDAGMRELWQTGWMHNRVRMATASFLVKDLLLPWQDGAKWFWDTLVDADLANNTLGWQWTAGCGADAAPYFRIFNPISQGEKFDAEGAYIRRYLPELARLPDQYIHRPFEAPASVLAAAGVELGTNYPHPIVDHGQARLEALDALATISASKGALKD